MPCISKETLQKNFIANLFKPFGTFMQKQEYLQKYESIFSDVKSDFQTLRIYSYGNSGSLLWHNGEQALLTSKLASPTFILSGVTHQTALQHAKLCGYSHV